MADFPGGIYSPRTKANKTGVAYNAAKTTIGYAEDVSLLDAEVVAIETFLSPKEKMIWLPAESFRVPGLKPAAFVEYGISNALEFEDAKEQIIFSKIHIPYDIDPTIQPKLFLGWSSPTISQNCKWKLEYLWRAPNEAMDAAAEAIITDVYESSSVSKGLVISEIQLANLSSADACILIRITRLGDEVEDTLGNSAFLHGVCLEYISDKLGKTI